MDEGGYGHDGIRVVLVQHDFEAIVECVTFECHREVRGSGRWDWNVGRSTGERGKSTHD